MKNSTLKTEPLQSYPYMKKGLATTPSASSETTSKTKNTSVLKSPSLGKLSLSAVLDTPEHSEEDLEEIRVIFNVFDTTSSGRLSYSDIMEAMRRLGEEMQPDEIGDMLRVADTDGDGYISFDDFVSILMS